MRKLYLLFSLLFCFSTHAGNSPQGNQFILVITPDGDANQGLLQRYQRLSNTHQWNTVGNPMSVLVGKNGMALGFDFNNDSIKLPIKKEGDGRTPMGIFNLGPAFGFDKTSSIANFDYLPINEKTVCVDDPQSHYYNQVLDSSTISKPDWHSQEDMHKISVYRYGSIIQYNKDGRTPGAGSCIFIHLSTSHTTGTLGCVAMDEANLKILLAWLNKTQNPTIGLFTKSVYKEVRDKHDLPQI
ncbi:MAG: L,D-transpeptidase [Candidatus Berkiellales bacterium]